VPSIPNPRESATESGIPRLAADWRGHSQVTSVALLSLLERVVAGQTEFSRAERLFCVACEFWAAVNARELDAHLSSEMGDPLSDARFAFSAIGAKYVVKILNQAAVGAAGSRSRGARRQRIADVEEQLLCASDPVDILIARFAWHLRGERRSIAPATAVREQERDYRRFPRLTRLRLLT
jgi:hypothetical protein